MQAADESTCKPGSVRDTWCHVTAIHLDLSLLTGSSGLPAGIGRAALERLREPADRFFLTLLRVGFA
jgi:hypothetical protein